jgi:hypothetical protein
MTVDTIGGSCAACAAIEFKTVKGSWFWKTDTIVAQIEKDYMVDGARTMFGEQAQLVANVLNSEQKWDILLPELDNRAFSQAILAERVDTFLSDAIGNATGFTKWLWAHNYENTKLVSDIQRELGFRPPNTGYDNMTYYPFWVQNRSNKAAYDINIFKDGKRQGMQNVRMTTEELILESLAELHEVYRHSNGLRIITKVYMNRAGARDRLPGMTKPISWHRTNQTQTYYAIADHVAKAEVKSLTTGMSAPILRCPAGPAAILYDTYNMPNIGSNNRNNMSCEQVQAANIAASIAVQNTYRGTPIQLHHGTPYVGHMLCDDGSVKVTTDGCNDQAIIQSKLCGPQVEKALHHHASRLKKNSEQYDLIMQEIANHNVFTGNHEYQDRAVHLYDPSVLDNEPEALVAMAQQCKKMYIWCPIQVFEDKGVLAARLDKSQHAWTINRQVYQAMTHGITLSKDGHRMSTCRILGPLRIYLIEQRNVWMEPKGVGAKFTAVEVPVFLLDPVDALSTGTLMQTKWLMVNNAFFDNLYRRALRSDTKLRDLLVQARTLVNISQFSTSTVSTKYSVKVADAKQTALIVWYTTLADRKKYSLLNTTGTDTIIMDSLKASALLLAGKATDKVADLLDWKYIAAALQHYLPEGVVKELLTTTIDTLNKLKMHIDKNKRMIVSSVHTPIRKINLQYESTARMTTHIVAPVKPLAVRLQQCEKCNDPQFTQLLDAAGVQSKCIDTLASGNILLANAACNHSPHQVTVRTLWDTAVKTDASDIVIGTPADNTVATSRLSSNSIHSETNAIMQVPEDVVEWADPFNCPVLIDCIIIVNKSCLIASAMLSKAIDCTIVCNDPQIYSLDDSNRWVPRSVVATHIENNAGTIEISEAIETAITTRPWAGLRTDRDVTGHSAKILGITQGAGTSIWPEQFEKDSQL